MLACRPSPNSSWPSQALQRPLPSRRTAAASRMRARSTTDVRIELSRGLGAGERRRRIYAGGHEASRLDSRPAIHQPHARRRPFPGYVAMPTWTTWPKRIFAACCAWNDCARHAARVAAYHSMQSRAYCSYHARLLVGAVLAAAEREDFIVLSQERRSRSRCACGKTCG